MMSAGRSLGPYEIVAQIGTGGMGEVYRAWDSALNRDVALKVLPADLVKDPETLRRFRQEAQITAALNHPNILYVFFVGEQDGCPYIVSELLQGQTLRQILQVSGALPVRRSLKYAGEISSGIAAAHSKGVVHRDIKPENIFITNDDRVKILDFGLAKLVEAQHAAGGEDTQTIATEVGMVVGTVGYMSPEQVRGEPIDHRSDIFSLGVVIYEMLSGQKAFKRESSAETMAAILKEDPAAFDPHRGIAPDLERLVRHCLEKNRELRFQSAQA